MLGNNRVGGPVSRMFFLSKDSEPLLMVPVGSLRQGDLGRNKRMFTGGRRLRGNNTGELSHGDEPVSPETLPLQVTEVIF